MSKLQGLNQQQLDAGQYIDGPQLVNAGPGTGKTKLITQRIAHLVVDLKIAADSILALTFTNKAADEMRSRVWSDGGQDCYPVVVGTFHSFILRYVFGKFSKHEFFAEQGYPNGIITLDEDDASKLLDNALSSAKSPVRTLLTLAGLGKRSQIESKISYLRAQGLTSSIFARQLMNINDDVPNAWAQAISMANNVDTDDLESYAATQVKQFLAKYPFIRDCAVVHVWKKYDGLCRNAGGVDFDQMLLLADQLLKADPRVAKTLAARFPYIHLDEFQDTNPVQFSFISSIANAQRNPWNLTCVGDGRQSIYGFRASDMRIMIGYPEQMKEFGGCHMVNLVQNYRSSRPIIDMANTFAVTMPDQLTDGQLNPSGVNANLTQPVEVHHFGSDKRESAWMADKIKTLLASGVSGKDIFVLYRNKSLFADLENALNMQSIPYQIVGNISFWEKREVKDVVALIRVLTRWNDPMAMARVIDNSRSSMTGNSFRKELQEKPINAWDYLKSKITDSKSDRASQVKEFIMALIEAKDQAAKTLEFDVWTEKMMVKLFMEQGDTESEALSLAQTIISRGEINEETRASNLQLYVSDPHYGYKAFCEDFDVVRVARSFWHKFMAPVLLAQEEKSWNQKGFSQEQRLRAWDERVNNVNIVLDHVVRTLESSVKMTDMVNEMALRTENAQESSSEQVQLMTMHASKGLEADYVFMLGVENEAFFKSDDYSSENMAEEGRIFYVAGTRARKQTFMTTSGTRFIRGKTMNCSPLEFLTAVKGHVNEHFHDGVAPQLDQPRTSVAAAQNSIVDESPLSLLEQLIRDLDKTGKGEAAHSEHNGTPQKSSPHREEPITPREEPVARPASGFSRRVTL